MSPNRFTIIYSEVVIDPSIYIIIFAKGYLRLFSIICSVVFNLLSEIDVSWGSNVQSFQSESLDSSVK